MKKLSLAVLVSTALLTSPFTQAKMLSATGSAGGVSMENSHLNNSLHADNVEDSDICQGVMCTAGDGSTINTTIGYVGMTNSTVTNTMNLSNVNDSALCQGVVCTAN